MQEEMLLLGFVFFFLIKKSDVYEPICIAFFFYLWCTCELKNNPVFNDNLTLPVSIPILSILLVSAITKCDVGFYYCKKQRQCINGSRCDNVDDCGDKTDESVCGSGEKFFSQLIENNMCNRLFNVFFVICVSSRNILLKLHVLIFQFFGYS